MVKSILCFSVFCFLSLANAQAPSPSGEGTDQNILIENAIASSVNVNRAQVPLSPLALDPTLCAVAQTFAEDMLAKGYFSHVSPSGETMEMRMQAGGVKFGWAGENIAEGYLDVPSVMTSWMNSPGHRENILGAHYLKIGVGHTGNLWVQEFTD